MIEARDLFIWDSSIGQSDTIYSKSHEGDLSFGKCNLIRYLFHKFGFPECLVEPFFDDLRIYNSFERASIHFFDHLFEFPL